MTTDTRLPLYKRKRVWIPALIIGIPALVLAWWLGSPLFLNSTVVEDFPRAAAGVIPDDMTAAEVEQVMLDAEETSVDAADAMPGAGSPVALVSGDVVGADSFHRGTGTATIYELEDGTRVLRLEGLDVTNGPDLHVLLSPVADPEGRSDVTAEGYIDLGGLKGNRGDQNYDIPADYELPAELSVVIYCKPFHVIFSTATLT